MDNHVSFGNIVFGLASARPTPQGLSGAPKFEHPKETKERAVSLLNTEFDKTLFNIIVIICNFEE